MALLPAWVRRILGPEAFPLVRVPLDQIEPQVYQPTPQVKGVPTPTPPTPAPQE